MSATTVSPIQRSAPPSIGRVIARWMVSFAGFPLGGLAAMTLVGPVDGITSALAGGFLTGLVLGVVQAWALRAGRRAGVIWALATAVGLAVGLAVGSSIVGFATGLADLAIQGAICGAFVGIAQAVVLRAVLLRAAVRRAPRTGHSLAAGRTYLLAAWPLYLAGVWAVGWTLTTAIGVRVDEQFTVFGSAGAITVAALTAVLPLALRTRSIAADFATTEGKSR